APASSQAAPAAARSPTICRLRSADCPRGRRSGRRLHRRIRQFMVCRPRARPPFSPTQSRQSSRAISSRRATGPRKPPSPLPQPRPVSRDRRLGLFARHRRVGQGAGPMEEFYRIRRLPPYVFEQVNRAKAAARNAGGDIIDLGMGNPDLPAPAHVVEKLKDTLGKPRTDRYSASRGIAGLRRAQAAYYARRFGIKLNPETEIVTTLGSKEGFANVAQAITAPGDVIVVPNPSYPIHAFGFLMAGAAIRAVPSEPTPSFFEALERAIIRSIPKPIAVVVCYPANPTAYVATLD